MNDYSLALDGHTTKDGRVHASVNFPQKTGPWIALVCMLLAALLPGIHRFAHLGADHLHAGSGCAAAQACPHEHDHGEHDDSDHHHPVTDTHRAKPEVPRLPLPANDHPDCGTCQTLALLNSATIADPPTAPWTILCPLQTLDARHCYHLILPGGRDAVPARAPPLRS